MKARAWKYDIREVDKSGWGKREPASKHIVVTMDFSELSYHTSTRREEEGERKSARTAVRDDISENKKPKQMCCYIQLFYLVPGI